MDTISFGKSHSDHIIRINRSIISVFLLLFACSFKWFFRGTMQRGDKIECTILLIGIIISLGMKFALDVEGIVWLGFVIPLFYRMVFVEAGGRKVILPLLYILIILFVVFVRPSRETIEFGLLYLKLYGIFIAITVLVQYFDKYLFVKNIYDHSAVPYSSSTYRFYLSGGYYLGIFYEPHETACYIAFALGIVVVDILFKERSVLSWFMLVLLGIGFLLTQKKGIIIATVIAIIITVLSKYRVNKALGKMIFAIISIIIISVLAFNFILKTKNTILVHRFQRFLYSVINHTDEDYGRLLLFRHALMLWKENPMIGIGWKNFIEIAPRRFFYSRPHEVNCDYLQLLCETGIVGFTLWMIPVIYTFSKSCMHIKTRNNDIWNKEEEKLSFMAYFAQILILVYAAVEIPFYDETYFSVYIFSCLIIKYLNGINSRKKVVRFT